MGGLAGVLVGDRRDLRSGLVGKIARSEFLWEFMNKSRSTVGSKYDITVSLEPNFGGRYEGKENRSLTCSCESLANADLINGGKQAVCTLVELKHPGIQLVRGGGAAVTT